MVRHLGRHRVLWLLTAALALVAAGVGVVNPSIYEGVVSAAIMPGVLSQDLLALALAILVVALSLHAGAADVIQQVVILGAMGAFFYVYGIYTIEQVYDALYLVYMAIFGLAFYTLVHDLADLREDVLRRVTLAAPLRTASAVWALITALIFYPLWIGQLVPLMQAGDRIEYTFSIYILDLCFIMPAFVILAVRVLRRDGLGLLAMPALFIVGFAVLAPLALAEALKPLIYGRTMDPGAFWMFLVLSVVYLVLTVVHLRKLQVGADVVSAG
ncbi:MAG: hypothetical protein ACP5HG_14065 [Anaerolineae bacterium]